MVCIVFVIPVFGLSDYWKSWNEQQKTIIHAIKEPDLSRLMKDDILLCREICTAG